MQTLTEFTPTITRNAALVALIVSLPVQAVDLLQRYPTTLTTGALEPDQARPWQFTASDIFRVSRFHLEVGDQLKIESGPADLGIGHCADGAVCAILIPTGAAKLTRPGVGSAEEIAHLWLRFHPGQINRLFPPETVSAGSGSGVITPMRTIASGKFRASYHAGMNAMIPEPKDMTVDLDTKAGVRRFFMVDTQARSAKYANAFERQPVRLPALAGRGTANAPRILFTKPANSATDVDPLIKEISVTFDQDMSEGFSWTGSGPEYPPSPDGAAVQWRGKRTCVLPVKLQPAHHYQLGINSPDYKNFCSATGQPVEPMTLSFTTK